MKTLFLRFIFFLLLLFLPAISLAQFGIDIDRSYGTNGKTEINIGGFSNEAVGYNIDHTTKIVSVCGRVSSAVSGVYQIGMVRLDSSGKPDKTFAGGGIASFSWGISDDPNDMQIDPAGLYILAGASGNASTLLPAVYRIKKNGIPDSSFGVNGRLVRPFSAQSGGEATNVFNNGSRYIACGSSQKIGNNGIAGFGVMGINQDGTPDSTFGTQGTAVIPALVHSVHGFFPINGTNTIMCGISDTGLHEIILAMIDITGKPAPSFGINGLIHTGVVITGGDTIFAALEGNLSLDILLPAPNAAPTQITLCRFNIQGKLDTTYGAKGIAKNFITPSIKPKGLNILNDGSAAISGMTFTGTSIFARLNDTSAAPDPKYFPSGIAVFDIDNGQYSNYIKYYEPTGKFSTDGICKRYVGIGGSNHNDGIEYMMIARFNSCPLSGVDETPANAANSIVIYPDPANAVITIQTSGGIKNIRIVDEFGRSMRTIDIQNYSSDAKSYSYDAAKLPNGLYYCIAQTADGQIMRKFMVSH